MDGVRDGDLRRRRQKAAPAAASEAEHDVRLGISHRHRLFGRFLDGVVRDLVRCHHAQHREVGDRIGALDGVGERLRVRGDRGEGPLDPRPALDGAALGDDRQVIDRAGRKAHEAFLHELLDLDRVLVRLVELGTQPATLALDVPTLDLATDDGRLEVRVEAMRVQAGAPAVGEPGQAEVGVLGEPGARKVVTRGHDGSTERQDEALNEPVVTFLDELDGIRHWGFPRLGRQASARRRSDRPACAPGGP